MRFHVSEVKTGHSFFLQIFGYTPQIKVYMCVITLSSVALAWMNPLFLWLWENHKSEVDRDESNQVLIYQVKWGQPAVLAEWFYSRRCKRKGLVCPAEAYRHGQRLFPHPMWEAVVLIWPSMRSGNGVDLISWTDPPSALALLLRRSAGTLYLLQSCPLIQQRRSPSYQGRAAGRQPSSSRR